MHIYLFGKKSKNAKKSCSKSHLGILEISSKLVPESITNLEERRLQSTISDMF